MKFYKLATYESQLLKYKEFLKNNKGMLRRIPDEDLERIQQSNDINEIISIVEKYQHVRMH